jgi:hypothetical protein
MGPKQTAEEKITDELKKLSKVEFNKTCAECPERMPGYVNLSHKTFVCTKCAGVLRDLQLKIKGISMSKFKQQYLDEMSSGGNEAHNNLYMAKWPPRDPIPQDPSRMKDHIKLKYIECRWKGRDGEPASSGPSGGGFGEEAFADSGAQQKSFSGFSSATFCRLFTGPHDTEPPVVQDFVYVAQLRCLTVPYPILKLCS